MWKIIHYGVFLYVQSFMDKFSLKLIIFNPIFTLHACDTLLQIENLFQLLVELLISASISQYYDNLGCYAPLITQFIFFFFQISIKTHKNVLK
jgi:hypothetical protein